MRNTLFNSEVEGFTRSKFSNIKLGILAGALLVAFVGLGWLISEVVGLIGFMDVFTDASA